MGISFSGDGDQRKITARCDHTGCRVQATVSIVYHGYDRATGKEYRGERNPDRPFLYWRKVFENPRRRNVKKLILIGHSEDWPDVTAYCVDHIPDNLPRTIPKHRQQDIEQSMRRVDIYG